MKKNLTSPRYLHTVTLTPCDVNLIRIGVLKLSPGQWVSVDGTSKARFVRISANGDLWLTHGTNAAQFQIACKKWLPLDKAA